jgi:hypothetical protein
MPIDNVKKPTLLSIRLRTAITTQQLAKAASVGSTETYLVEIGGFVERAIGEKVIAAFSLLSGTTYTLDDIRFQHVSTPVPQHKELCDLPTMKHSAS